MERGKTLLVTSEQGYRYEQRISDLAIKDVPVKISEKKLTAIEGRNTIRES